MTIYKAFWDKLPKHKVVIGLIPLLLIIVLEIGTTSLIPYTRKTVVDSLVAYDYSAFVFFVALAFGNSLILSGAQALKEWTGNRLAFLGREALMKTIKKPWINRDGKTNLSNPCARLNDDTRLATEVALKVFVEVLISLVIVISLLFSIIKWPMLLGIAVVYSAVSILIAALFREPMTNKKYTLLDAEGAHRVSLTRISMQQGDYTSKSRWEVLRIKYAEYIGIVRNYKLFHAIQTAAMYSIPFIVMAPEYFAKNATIGDIMQGTLTFDLLVLNATIWVVLYPQIIESRTAFLRVEEFYKEVTDENSKDT